MDIHDLLAALPGVTIVRDDPAIVPGRRFFELAFDQLTDHDDAGSVHFAQRAYLLHKDTTSPFVLATTGYSLYFPEDYTEELTQLLDGNQLFVEQRFFASSRPSPADWSKLTIRQAATDHHVIATALHTIYAGKWISTGVSKGGMTSVYHRRFFPSDVDATVAYVAPESFARNDSRYTPYLNNIGPASCHVALRALQRELLKRRSSMEAWVTDEAKQLGLAYTYMTIDEAYESSVVSMPWALFQYGDVSQCDSLPSVGASDSDLWDFLQQVNPVSSSDDDNVLAFEPYDYQADKQLGYPEDDLTGIDDLAHYPTSATPYPSAGTPPTFEPEAMKDVQSWLSSGGVRMLFVYGQNDPWSGGRFDVSGAQDALSMVAPGQNHGAEINTLGASDRAIAEARIAAWMGVKAHAPAPGSSSARRNIKRRLRPKLHRR